MTKPATVSYGPSGSSTPVSSAKSSRLSRPSTSRSPPTCARLGLLDVVLVADVADELLDEVLERDDAGGAAVLVDDDGQVRARRTHLEHRREHALAARQHEHRRGRGRSSRMPRSATSGARMSRMCTNPIDVVLRLAEHRVARVRQVDHDPRRLVRRQRRVEELHLGARHHHLAHLALPRLEHVVDELALLRRERLLRGQDAAQLVVGDELLVGVRVAAERAHEEVGRARQQPDERTA